MDSKGESRRSFLKQTALVGSGVAAGLVAGPFISPTPPEAVPPQVAQEQAPISFFEYPQLPQIAVEAICHVLDRDLHGREVPWDHDSDMGKGLAAHGLLDLLEEGTFTSRPESVVPVSYEDDWDIGERRVVFSLNFGGRTLPLEVSVSASLLTRNASFAIVNPADPGRNFNVGFYRDLADENQTVRMFNISGKGYGLTTPDPADARFASPLYGDLMNRLEDTGVTIKRDDKEHPVGGPSNLVALEGGELSNFVNAVDGTRGLIRYIMSTMPQATLNFAQENMRPAK